MLLNFLRPSTGEAYLFDQPVSCAKTRQRLGYLPESVNLHPYYSGQRLLEFYGGLLGIRSADRARQAAELLERVGLVDAAGQRISTYSKGMLQRLGLAQALLNDPELLILDEPTADLDILARETLLATLYNLARKRPRMTTLVVTHHLEDLIPNTDHVLLLGNGRTIAAGSPDEVLTSHHLSNAFGCSVDVHRHNDRWQWSVAQSTWDHLTLNPPLK